MLGCGCGVIRFADGINARGRRGLSASPFRAVADCAVRGARDRFRSKFASIPSRSCRYLDGFRVLSHINAFFASVFPQPNLRRLRQCVSAILGLGVACLAGRSAESWSVRVWTRRGLSNRVIAAIDQAPDGFLWLATPDSLARFDGMRFQEFPLADFGPIQKRRIRRMVRARDGHVWIASDTAQVVRLGGGPALVLEDGLPRSNIQSMVEGVDGSIWVSYVDGEVCQIKDGRIAWVGWPEGFKRGTSDGARCVLAVDAAGALWFCQGGHMGILHGTKTEQWHRHIVPSSRIFPAKGGGMWLVGSSGIYLVSPQGEFERRDGEGGPRFTAMPNTLLEDRSGALWIGTLTDGLMRFSSDGAVEQIPTSFPEIDALAEDSEGNIWAGTDGGGLNRVTPRAITLEGDATGLPQQSIQTLCEDRDGTIWAASQNGVLLRRGTPGGWETSNAWPGAVTSIVPDPQGGIWFGSTDRKLYRMRGAKIDAWGADDGIDAHTVNIVRVANDGTVWFATERSPQLMRWRDGKIVSLRLPKKIIHAESMAVDATGRVWLGCNGGNLFRAEGDKVVDATPRHGPHDAIRGIEAEPDGTLWLAYRGGGLGRLRNGKLARIKAADGLHSDSISYLASDARGWLWCGGEDGVFKVRLSMLNDFIDRRIAHVQSVNFGAEDGLPNLQVTTKTWGAAIRTHDGRIWIPMGTALVIADPSRVRENQSPPAVFVTRVVADAKVVAEYHGVIEGAKRASAPAIASAPLAVPAIHQQLDFEFTGLNYSAPENVRFRYRLDPLDHAWIAARSERTASYVRVPPGTYQFHVEASNGDGVWNEAAAAVMVRIAPFFWQTWWFRSSIVLSGLLGVYGVFRWRVHRFKARSRELEAQNVDLERRIAERTADLAKSLEALKASEYFYHSLVESLPQAIVRKDAGGRITYANSGFAELVGQPLDGLVGRLDSELYPADLAAKIRDEDRRALETRQPVESESVIDKPGQPKRYLHVKKVPLYDANEQPFGIQVLFWDRTVFRETEESLKQAQRNLLEASRIAGMAEVATGVLHNIGNALNSVNVSATVAHERIGRIRTDGLSRVAELLIAQRDRLGDFVVNDPRGRKLPEFLQQLSQHLAAESAEASREIDALRAGVEHIKDIVAAQQDFARASDLVEVMPAAELVEYALEINAAAMARHNIEVLREFSTVPPVRVQRQKALQILVNLINNAKDAMDEIPVENRRLTLALRAAEGGRVEIRITDQGKGIPPENLTRIFQFGFTTKTSGHGFGLHSSANSAREMGGSLTVVSDGPGLGATFVFSVPGA